MPPILLCNIEDSLLKTFDELVQTANHGRQYHLQSAVECYVETEISYLSDIEEGVADAAAGRLTDFEVVKAEWMASLANNHVD
ncbi:transcriptional regulator [Pseudomonas cichorii]|nr:transcriptional regulator [Pseudomonas cichorii]